MASIEVFCKPIEIFGRATQYYHECVVYTNDAGQQFFSRGGHASNGQLSPNSGGGSGSSGSTLSGSGVNAPFGNIVTYANQPYVPGTIDFAPPGQNDGAVIASGTQAQIAPYWNNITSYVQGINSQNIAYGLEGPNSNSVVNSALREAGLPPPPNQGLNDNYPAPGADVPLAPESLSSAALNTLSLLSDYAGREIANLTNAIDNAAENAVQGVGNAVGNFFGQLIGDVIGSVSAATYNAIGQDGPNGITDTTGSGGGSNLAAFRWKRGKGSRSLVGRVRPKTDSLLSDAAVSPADILLRGHAAVAVTAATLNRLSHASIREPLSARLGRD